MVPLWTWRSPSTHLQLFFPSVFVGHLVSTKSPYQTKWGKQSYATSLKAGGKSCLQGLRSLPLIKHQQKNCSLLGRHIMRWNFSSMKRASVSFFELPLSFFFHDTSWVTRICILLVLYIQEHLKVTSSQSPNKHPLGLALSVFISQRMDVETNVVWSFDFFNNYKQL